MRKQRETFMAVLVGFMISAMLISCSWRGQLEVCGFGDCKDGDMTIEGDKK